MITVHVVHDSENGAAPSPGSIKNSVYLFVFSVFFVRYDIVPTFVIIQHATVFVSVLTDLGFPIVLQAGR